MCVCCFFPVRFDFFFSCDVLVIKFDFFAISTLFFFGSLFLSDVPPLFE